MNIVSQAWARAVIGSPGKILHTKLMRLKKILKEWNWSCFGNIFSRKNELQQKLQILESALQGGWTDSGQQKWDACRRELLQVEAWENEMLCSKARLNWAKDGDRNTKYFHALIQERRKKQVIQLKLANGEITTEPSEIGTQAVQFFSDLFSASPYHLEEGLFQNIQSSISEE